GVERALHLAVIAQHARPAAERVFGGDDLGDREAPVLPAIRRALAIDHHRDADRGSRLRRRHCVHVFFEIAMVGNLAEKSLLRSAILTATWRATRLESAAISPSGSLTTVGRPLSAWRRIDRLSGNAP